MISYQSRRNSTTLDESGLKHGLVRGKEESLNEFHKRVIKANANLLVDKESFYKSLGYITELQDINIFKIEKVNAEDNIDIAINDTRITLHVNSELIYNQKLENVKFLKDLKTELDLINSISVSVITTEDWQYKRSLNLLPATSKRTQLKKSMIEYSGFLPDNNILSLQDLNGYMSEEVNQADDVDDYTKYNIADGEILNKYEETLEQVMYTYEDFPFIVKWCPIKAYTVYQDSFNDLIKDRVKNNEQFGLIDENQPLDNNETVELLSQKGAEIVNKILSKQNTYWGK